MEAVREEEVKLRGVGFMKEVGFKAGVEPTKVSITTKFFYDSAAIFWM